MRREFLLILIALQMTAFGITRRSAKGDIVIPPSETISDSLFASGENVNVQGRVEGNLFMAGEKVELTGDVDGDLFAAAEEVRISGKVTGSVIAAAKTVVIEGSNGGNFYGAGRTVRIAKGGKIAQDAYTGAQTLTVDGEVGRGLTAAGRDASIAGMVGRAVTFAGNRLVVLQGGSVGGGIRARVNDPNQVQIENGASVQGGVNVSPVPLSDQRSRWERPGTYVWQICMLMAAFLTGWLLLAMFPGFFTSMVERVHSLRSLGIGIAALILIPIAAVILFVTVILIPISVGAMFLYIAGLYLSQIFVAGYLGRELLDRHSAGPPTVLALLVGLIILHVLFVLPFGLGALARLAVGSIGMGAMFLELQSRLRPATLAHA
jgi:cytoskeletal protein CcmA (bactofilin family)